MSRDEGGREDAVAAAPFAMSGAAASRPVALPERRWLRFVAAVPALFFLAMIVKPPLNHDAAAVLNFSERWLAGARLYVELIDVNPPLIFILNLIPAWIAKHTPLVAPQALLLCLLAHAAMIWRMTVALRRGRAEGPVEAAVLTAAFPLLIVLAGSDFGQREVLMAISAIPYVLLAERRIEGVSVPWRLALGVSVAAALAFALKPHFLAVPALVEALVLLRRGRARALRDPVPWVMALVWVIYLASIPVFFPDYFASIVPLVWEVYAGIHGAGPLTVLVTDLMGSATLLMLVVLPLALRRGAGALSQGLALATVGAFLSAWVQHKGWTYHVLPITILAFASAAAALSRWADEALPQDRARATAPVLAVVAAFGIGGYAMRGGETPWRQFWFNTEQTGRFTEWLRREAFGGRILVLSPEILPVYPSVTYAEAQPTLRTMSIWPLQGAYRTCPAGPAPYRTPAQMGAAEYTFWHRTAEDFDRAPPRAVLVTEFAHIPACGDRFDLVAYFSTHPLFARNWSRYRPAGEMDGYRLFLRMR